MINKKIIKIRVKLDKLDIQMLNIIKKRTILVNSILKNKKHKKDIIDKKRINIILKKIKKQSKQKKIDWKITNQIWINMINAFIKYEYRNFNKK